MYLIYSVSYHVSMYLFLRNICFTLSSCLKTDNAKIVSVEQMKVDSHKDLELMIKDWMMFIDKIEVKKKLSKLIHYRVAIRYQACANLSLWGCFLA